MKKLILGLVVIGIIAFVSFYSYHAYYNKSYEDKEYEFVLLNTRGWKQIEPMEGNYLTFATFDKNQVVVSMFTVNPIVIENREEDIEEFKKTCMNNAKSVGYTYESIDKVTLNEFPGYKCSMEGTPDNSSQLYVLDMYYLFNGELFNKVEKKYDYMLFTTYPKTDENELKLVDRIRDDFWALGL